MSARGLDLTPRSPERPMAFLSVEARRGAVASAVIFAIMLAATTGAALLASPSTTGLAFIVAASAGTIGLAVATIVALLALPLATRLGHALAGHRALWIHVIVFAALGAAVGGTGGALLQAAAAVGEHRAVEASPLSSAAVHFGALGAIAVSGGWWFTAHRALRDDRMLVERDAN